MRLTACGSTHAAGASLLLGSSPYHTCFVTYKAHFRKHFVLVLGNSAVTGHHCYLQPPKWADLFDPASLPATLGGSESFYSFLKFRSRMKEREDRPKVTAYMTDSSDISFSRAGLKDIQASFGGWHVWWTPALNDVKRRYRRSRLGQFWLTLSMAITIGGLGTVYSTLFKMDVAEYLPYISITFVFWGIISTMCC
ncbi:hypothetical protein ACTMU2_39275 [Cupriavidus basilensis]